MKLTRRAFLRQALGTAVSPSLLPLATAVAATKGSLNPLFRGGLATWDGHEFSFETEHTHIEHTPVGHGPWKVFFQRGLKPQATDPPFLIGDIKA